MTITLELSRGHVAILDDIDAEQAKHKWYAHIGTGKIVYARRSVPRCDGRRTSTLLHRAIMGDGPPGKIIDHRNGDGLDCRRANLAWVTPSENSRNKSGARADNKHSPYLGVHYRKSGNIWLAQITVHGKKRHLGVFRTAEDAHAARVAAERELWGVMPRRSNHLS